MTCIISFTSCNICEERNNMQVLQIGKLRIRNIKITDLADLPGVAKHGCLTSSFVLSQLSNKKSYDSLDWSPLIQLLFFHSEKKY